MEDILQDSPGGEQYELSELVDATPISTPAPKSAVRNRAATTALLSGEPDKLVEKYQLLLEEGMQGQSVTHDEVMARIGSANRDRDMGHIIQLLGDKTIPMEQKRLIMNVANKLEIKDPRVAIQTASLEEGSEGEDLKGESARIRLADTLNEINQEAEDRQRMLNNFVAAHPDTDLGTVGQMAATEVVPFVRNKIAADIGKALDEISGKDFSMAKFVKNFLLPGTAKADLKNHLMNIPPSKRAQFTQKLLAAVKEGSAILTSENHYGQFVNAVNLLDGASTSKAEEWGENVLTVLDAFWVGSEFKALAGLAKGTPKAVFDTSKARRPGSANPGVSDAENVVESAKWELVDEPFNPFAARIGNPKKQLGHNPAAEAYRRLALNSVVRRENPVSPFSIVEQVNPAKARAMHETIVASTTDDVAEALTGVGRTQAIANNIYPQVATEDGSVLNKVDQLVKEQVENTGATRYTAQEFDSAVQTVQRDFRNASGLQINDAMTTFRVDGDSIIVEGHYATPGGSFTTPEAAREQAKFALRGYGIRDDEIIIMKRDGMEYVPVADGAGEGDYIVKVQHRYAVEDSKVENWNPLDVKRNWFDSIPNLVSQESGSLSGSLFDPGSMLHPTLTGSASIAADQSVVLENLLLKPIEDFRRSVKGFKQDRRLAIEDYLKEANFKGLRFEPHDLHARGFDQEEIAAIKKWRDLWDNHFYLENLDLVRTLNKQGFQVLDSNGTLLYAKSVQKNQNIANVLDPSTGGVKTLTKQEMDDLYNTGGTYAQLRRPISVGGQQVEHMIVRNTPNEYLRKIRDTDQILNYRDGYYTVNYAKGSKFVDEITVDSSGKETRRTVAVAGNSKDAEMFAKAQEASTGNKHKVREDVRGFEKDGDGYWDVNDASGRIAQRLRGKPLTTAQGINQLGNVGTYVDSPLDSASRAARSIAGRTVNRPVLETAKSRFMAQYAELLKTESGMTRFPSHISQLVDHGNHTSKLVRDARTTYGYIQFLEHGLVNGVDNLYKSGMHNLARMLNKYPIAERAALAAAHKSPTQMAKRTVFNAYIVGSNWVRQWIVQPHQAIRMVAYNPLGLNGMRKRVTAYVAANAGFKITDPETLAFIKFVDDSGMVAGVDRNSLVRGLQMEISDRSFKATRIAEDVRGAVQTLGFDLGEKANMLGHLAAVHEKWTRAGKNLADKTVRDQALTEARALALDLNRAGELHYTQGSAAAILQFLQMPHKAWLQLSNRKLPVAVRSRLFAWDMLMFGTGTGGMLTVLREINEALFDSEEILPDDPEARDIMLYGLEAYYINKVLSLMDSSGEQTRVDFSALSTHDMEGWARMYHALVDDGAFAAWAASPVGQLFAVDGMGEVKRDGRIPKAMKTMGRFFNVFEELDPENPTEFTAVLNDVASITSGWTAAQNAYLMYETRKKIDASGVIVDDSVTIPEVWAAGLGFGTKATSELYYLSRSLSKDKKAHEEDVMSRYRDIVNYYRKEVGQPGADIEHIQKVTSMLMRTFDNPTDLQMVIAQWKKDMTGKEMGLFKQMMTAAGHPDSQQMRDRIKMSPYDEATKQKLLQMHIDIKKAQDDIKED